jgi:hypothetical protein
MVEGGIDYVQGGSWQESLKNLSNTRKAWNQINHLGSAEDVEDITVHSVDSLSTLTRSTSTAASTANLISSKMKQVKALDEIEQESTDIIPNKLFIQHVRSRKNEIERIRKESPRPDYCDNHNRYYMGTCAECNNMMVEEDGEAMDI